MSPAPDEEAGLLDLYCTIVDHTRPLEPSHELRVLVAIRQAIAEIPSDGRPRAKRVLALMNRAADILADQ